MIAKFRASFRAENAFQASFLSDEAFSTGFQSVIKVGDLPETYTGEYNIIPDFSDQVLETKNKVLTDNVTIERIAVSKVSNLSGGNTVFIGGTYNG